MKNKLLYLECYSGISGDMTVSSLLDLGGDEAHLLETLASLQVPGYHIEIGRREKCGIDAARFDVILASESSSREYTHSHSHDHSPHQHNHGHDHQHSHHHGDQDHHHHHHHHDHPHDHAHGAHDHHGKHSHSHGAGEHDLHTHRNIHDIYAIIDASAMTDKAKSLARKTFQVVALAEAKSHGLPIEEVHFHEVGAVDSIVDICAACILIDQLGIDQVVVSEMYEGRGHVWCQHGVIPVPVPATLNIVTAHGLSLKLTDNEGEMITPTGAALAAALRTRETLPDRYQILKVGVGSGKKDFKRANILRSYLLEDLQEEQQGQEDIWLLETNLDDTTGEALGYTMEKLLEEGARDVFFTSIFMKKNRPAYQLSVLCTETEVAAMEAIIFTTTTSIGIRKVKMERSVLSRRMTSIDTPYGKVQVKAVLYHGVEYYSPEYEDLRRILKNGKITYKALYEEVLEEIRKLRQEA